VLCDPSAILGPPMRGETTDCSFAFADLVCSYRPSFGDSSSICSRCVVLRSRTRKQSAFFGDREGSKYETLIRVLVFKTVADPILLHLRRLLSLLESDEGIIDCVMRFNFLSLGLLCVLRCKLLLIITLYTKLVDRGFVNLKLCIWKSFI
jgi:hypothetical protein